jgi:arsenate reductase
MAEGWFRRLLEEHGKNHTDLIRSAGLKPMAVHPLAIRVMKEVGIDLSGHTSNHLDEYLDQNWDVVITVCNNAAEECPVFPGETSRLHWPFDDPDSVTGTEEEILNEFRRIRDEIGSKIESWLAKEGESGVSPEGKYSLHDPACRHNCKAIVSNLFSSSDTTFPITSWITPPNILDGSLTFISENVTLLLSHSNRIRTARE